MRVFQINTVCGYGSTGKIVVELANHIQSRGSDCEIAYGRSMGNTLYDSTYFIGSKGDHNTHGALSRLTDRQGFYSKKSTENLINHIIKYNPDVIHLHNLHGYYINIPIMFSFLSRYGRPVIWTLHDCWPFTGHCTYFDMANCNKWKNGCECCPQKKAYPATILFDNSKKNYQEKKKYFLMPSRMHIVTPSKWLQCLLNESFLSCINNSVINNGINLSNFKRIEGKVREKYNIGQKKILLGVASIWGERKGYQDFIRLANEIDNNTVIIMVGLNAQQMKQLPPSIIGVQRTNNIDELCQFYSDADYFLNLTYQDNFPTANIEALSCGTPVITYKTGGSVEIADELSGAVVNKGDISEIIRTINNSCFKHEDCIIRSKMFDANARYEDYYELYQNVICKDNGVQL